MEARYLLAFHILLFLPLLADAFKDKKGTRPTDMETVSFKASVHIYQKSKDIRICSGVIVDSIHVLTTASCFYMYLKEEYTAYIRVGSLKAHTGGMVHVVKKLPIIHHQFDVETHRHNIAIVTVKEYVIELGSMVNKVPINYDYIVGCQNVTILAFGEPFTSHSIPAKELYSANSKTMDIFQCGQALQNTIASKYYYEETLCIRRVTAKFEVCSSDEGGIVLYKNQLIGILSQMPGGLGCSGTLPYFFTRIGHYHSWLNTHLNKHLFEIGF